MLVYQFAGERSGLRLVIYRVDAPPKSAFRLALTATALADDLHARLDEQPTAFGAAIILDTS